MITILVPAMTGISRLSMAFSHNQLIVPMPNSEFTIRRSVQETWRGWCEEVLLPDGQIHDKRVPPISSTVLLERSSALRILGQIPIPSITPDNRS